MTDETETNDEGQSFAEFEAAANSDEQPIAADENETGDVVEDVSTTVDTSEEATDEAEPDKDEEKNEKRRSKPAHARIAELTAKLRQAERDLEASRAPPELHLTEADLAPPNPNDAKYEFGAADDQYIEDMVEHRVKVALARRDAQAAHDSQAKAIEAEATELNTTWELAAEKAVERYPDFQETVVESAANKEWPLLPLSAAAVSGHEDAADIAYHLATNRKDADKLANAERAFHNARAVAMNAGLSPDLIAVLAQPAYDRAVEIFEDITAKVRKPEAKKGKVVTDAPEPFKQQVRGSSGQFEVGADTTDFAAFERKVNGKR